MRLSEYDDAAPTVELSDLVWSIPGHRTLLDHHYAPRLPLVDQFRRLQRTALTAAPRRDTIAISFIRSIFLKYDMI